MKELVIISGKGGTGKTSLVSAFASLASNAVLCDADVDAADLHLILSPQVQEDHEFRSGHSACIQPEKCVQCGVCREMCRWDAIRKDFSVDDVACEGCAVCAYFCPEKAVEMVQKTCGQWFVSDTRFGTMVHARLGIAEENSGRLVTLVRQQAMEQAKAGNADLILTDGPPGIGCPVIAAIGGADALLIVTEPTVSGKHDMTRVMELARHFRVPALLCINKADLNPALSDEIEEFAMANGVKCLGRLPFDPVFTRAMIQAQSVIEYAPDSPVSQQIRELWSKVKKVAGI